jgi:hypothetical protein
MWDRNYRRAARQAFRDQRRAARAARRSYRYNNHTRGRFPFFRILLIILFAPLILQIFSGHGFFPLMPLVIIGILVFIWLRSSMFGSGNSGSTGSNSNYQQPNQYYQPPQQPYPPNQYYQPSTPAQPNTPDTPPYQSYEQGYQAPPQSDYPQGVQPYQGNPSPSTLEQYEEPQAQYPQEMPPMV